MPLVTHLHRPARERCCDFCGDYDHRVHDCPDLPPGWHPPRPRSRKTFHRLAVRGPSEPLEHPHHPE